MRAAIVLTVCAVLQMAARTRADDGPQSLPDQPLLSENQQRRLAGTVDGTDHHDEAFLALLEAVRTHAAELESRASERAVDVRAMRDNPSAYRGQVCRIRGELLQQTQLARPFDSVMEWFIANAGTGLPVIVYVVDLDQRDGFALHESVQVDAVFYKRVDFVARDQQLHRYPAFVGTAPVHLKTVAPASGAGAKGTSPAWTGLGWIGTIVLTLSVICVGLWLWVRRQRRLMMAGRSGQLMLRHVRLEAQVSSSVGQEVDDSAGLPDDPAAALAELRRRSSQPPPVP
jgi:hypothetical protein